MVDTRPTTGATGADVDDVGDVVRNARVDAIAAILMDHARVDWSDRTYACGGCRHRYEQRVESGELRLTPDVRAELSRLRTPGWTLAEYNAHVAAEIARTIASAGTATA